MNFSESGWNKIGHFWRWGRWRKKRIRRIRWYKFGADAFNFVFEKIKESCWQGMMHLGTLEVSLKVFDEELC